MVEDAFPGGFFVAHAKGTGGQASDGPPGSRHAPGGPRFTHAIFGGALVRTLLPARTTLTQREEKGGRHGLTNVRNRANQPPGVGGQGENENKKALKIKGTEGTEGWLRGETARAAMADRDGDSWLRPGIKRRVTAG